MRVKDVRPKLTFVWTHSCSSRMPALYIYIYIYICSTLPERYTINWHKPFADI